MWGMPVIRDLGLKFGMRGVLRRVGFRAYSRVRPEVRRLLLELIADARKRQLLEPAMVYEIYPITKKGPGPLYFGDDGVLRGPLLPSLLREAEELAVAVCTIGPGLEREVSDCFGRGEALRGTLLDGIGSVAVDSLMEEACQRITAEASSRGYQTSSPLTPGMPGLPMEEQRPLFEMVRAQEIGVSLTSSGIMVPRKSISMAIGIGPEMKTWTRAETCAWCGLRETCLYRIEAQEKKRGRFGIGRDGCSYD